VTKVLSTEEVNGAIEGPGKDFGKSKFNFVLYRRCAENVVLKIKTKF
jgi:hypothetical protein